jgi:hypothetical protein
MKSNGRDYTDPLYLQFKEFHRDNPHVYTDLVDRARKLKALGMKHIGIKLIFESARYDYAIKTNGEPYKLNNNTTAYYARLIMSRNPDLAGIFSTRRTKGLH